MIDFTKYTKALDKLLNNANTDQAIKNVIIVGRLFDIPDNDLHALTLQFNAVKRDALGIDENLRRLSTDVIGHKLIALDSNVQDALKAQFQKDFQQSNSDLNKYNLFLNLTTEYVDTLIEEVSVKIAIGQVDQKEIADHISAIEIAVTKENNKEKLSPQQEKELRRSDNRIRSNIIHVLKLEPEEAIHLLRKHFAWDDEALYVNKIESYKKQYTALEIYSTKKTELDFKDFLQSDYPLAFKKTVNKKVTWADSVVDNGKKPLTRTDKKKVKNKNTIILPPVFKRNQVLAFLNRMKTALLALPINRRSVEIGILAAGFTAWFLPTLPVVGAYYAGLTGFSALAYFTVTTLGVGAIAGFITEYRIRRKPNSPNTVSGKPGSVITHADFAEFNDANNDAFGLDYYPDYTPYRDYEYLGNVPVPENNHNRVEEPEEDSILPTLH